MRTLIACLVATWLLGCASANGHRDVPGIQEIATAMAAYAAGETTTTRLVEQVTGSPPHSTDPRADYHHGAFSSREGYRFTNLDARIRHNDFDAAVFVALTLETEPCLPLDDFGRLVDGMVHNPILGLPSRHAPDGYRARGFERIYSAGTLFAYARGDQTRCADLITVRRKRPG